MSSGARTGVALLLGFVVSTAAAGSRAQDVGDPAPAAPPASDSRDSSPTVTAKGADGTTINVTGSFGAPAQSTTTSVVPVGIPQPGVDINPGLPSSSRGTIDTSRMSDGFDLNNDSGSSGPVRGNAEGAGVFKKGASNVPAMHQVRKGDTLWDLCNGYYQNPWLWPKVWSYNPQIQNPHWIYPGDQVRLRTDVPVDHRDSIVLGSGQGVPQAGGGGGFISRRAMVPRDTVFLRNVGYIDDPKKDVWGELVGSQKEQMLLTEGNDVYVMMRPGVDLKLGQLLTVFRSVRTPEKVPGARKPPGEIIAFKGAVKIDGFNPKTRIARGQLVESLDVIERGDKLGPVGRRFDVVPPRRNEQDLEARVLTSLYPHEIMGQHQIVFVDRGAKDGLTPGNRLFVIRRGDEWRHTLKTTTAEARTKVRTDVPEHVKVEVTPLRGKDEDFPEEVVGELRVLRTDDYSSVTIVTSAEREIEPGARVVAKKGF
jgi:hypothetical protein